MTTTADKLNDIELDALKEIGSIGCAHAATAISGLIKKKMDISSPEIKIKKVDELFDTIELKKEGAEKVVAIYLELTKEFSGSILFMFSSRSALALADILMGRDITGAGQIGEDEKSALMEVGNIVVSAYANAIGEFLNTTVLLTPPSFAHNIPDAVMENIQKVMDKDTTHAVVFDTELRENQNLFKSYFILLPSPVALDTLISKLIK